jgi:hypothetical protein
MPNLLIALRLTPLVLVLVQETFLQASDHVRDQTMVDLGVRLEVSNMR